MMRKIIAILIVVGVSLSAAGSASTSDSLNSKGCTVWPQPILQPLTLRTPCGASFRGRVRSGDGEDEKTEYEIARSGVWQRQRWAGPPEQLLYANGASVATIFVSQDAAGDPTFSIEMGMQNPRSELRKTAETIAYLGETCRVWITAEPNTDVGPEHHDCLTEDGVPLLRDYATNKKGSLSQKLAEGMPVVARMIRFERAAVGQPDVRPPTTLFSWSSWGVVGEPFAAGEIGYEVRLQDKGDPVSRRLASAITLRRLGRTELMVKRQDGRIQTMDYKSANRLVDFASSDDGRRMLRIHSTSGTRAVSEAKRAMKRPPPAPIERMETILGEECRWYDLFPNMQDASEKECRTYDGIPLARRETSWGRQRLTARAIYLRRGSIQPNDMLPPNELISARFWLSARRPR